MKFNIDFSHEFDANEITYTSTIDYILWNEHFCKNLLNAGVLHSPDNKSDHSPIYCDINDTCNNATQLVKQRHNDFINPRSLKPPDWDNYFTTVEQNLQDVQTPFFVCCKNIHCKDERHIAESRDLTKRERQRQRLMSYIYSLRMFDFKGNHILEVLHHATDVKSYVFPFSENGYHCIANMYAVIKIKV